MHIVIAGGHGNIALRLTRLLRADGEQVRSLIRNPHHAGDVRAAGAEPVVCDLEFAGDDDADRAVAGADAIVFAAGAGPGSGAERKTTMDFGGALRLMAAARRTGVARFVMVSSIGADADASGDDTFAVYLRAKGKADDALRASGLEHTIVRPVSLTDEPGSGRVRIAEHTGAGQVSRDDVAAVLRAVLREPRTVGLTFEVAAGDAPVDEALAGLLGAA